MAKNATEPPETAKFAQFPVELSTAEAAEILGVSTDTILRLKRAGLLEYRDAAAPGQRARYRFTLESVAALRTNYRRDIPIVAPAHRSPERRKRVVRRPSRHLRIQDECG